MEACLCYSIKSRFISIVSNISAKVSFYRDKKWQRAIVAPGCDNDPYSFLREKTTYDFGPARIQTSSRIGPCLDEQKC